MPDFCHNVVQAVEELRVLLREDGSEVELVSVGDQTIELRVRGFLCDCPSSALDLYQEIRGFLQGKIPQLEDIRII
jgi:Fe-S cluster biogenesis protein NfuA